MGVRTGLAADRDRPHPSDAIFSQTGTIEWMHTHRRPPTRSRRRDPRRPGAGRLSIEWPDGHATGYDLTRCAGCARAPTAAARPGCRAGSTAHPTLTAEQTRLVDVRWSATTRSPRPGATATTPATTPSPCCASAARAPSAGRAAAGERASRGHDTPTATRSTHDRRHDPVPRRPPHRRDQGHGVRARRPQPRARRQPHGRAPLARRRRDPRVHEPARGHPPPGARPARQERHAARARTRSSRCASTAPSCRGR